MKRLLTVFGLALLTTGLVPILGCGPQESETKDTVSTPEGAQPKQGKDSRSGPPTPGP